MYPSQAGGIRLSNLTQDTDAAPQRVCMHVHIEGPGGMPAHRTAVAVLEACCCRVLGVAGTLLSTLLLHVRLHECSITMLLTCMRVQVDVGVPSEQLASRSMDALGCLHRSTAWTL